MLPLLSEVITTGLVPRPRIRRVNYSIPVHRNFCLKIPTPHPSSFFTIQTLPSVRRHNPATGFRGLGAKAEI